ncbi:MAG: outer membrane beta-barrel protein [Pseudomonadota bacterium]
MGPTFGATHGTGRVAVFLVAGAIALSPATAEELLIDGDVNVRIDPADRSVLSRLKDELVAHEQRVGPNFLFISVRDRIAFNDNVYAEETDSSDAFVSRAMVEVAARTDWGRHRIELNGSAEDVRYFDLPLENHTNFGGVGKFTLDTKSGGGIRLRLGAAQEHEQRTAPESVNGLTPTPVRNYLIRTEIFKNFNRLTATLDTRVARSDFDDVPAANGVIIDNDFRDLTKMTGIINLGYEHHPRHTTFFRLTASALDYPDGADRALSSRDSTGVRVETGVFIGIAPLTLGEVFIGYSYREFVGSRLRTVSEPIFGLRVSSRPTALTGVEASIRQGLAETSVESTAAVTIQRAKIKIDHEFKRNVTFRLDGLWGREKYRDSFRQDKVYAARAQIDWQINRHARLSVSHEYNRRVSNQPDESFRQAVTSAQVSFVL